MTRVFISSTVKDLGAYRNTAKDVVLRMGWHPVMVNEHELIAAGKPLEACMEMAYECDLFIVLAGYRYGFVPTVRQHGDGVKSIVRWELSAWREKMKEEGGYYPLAFVAQHPTLRCGEGEDRDAAEMQIRFRAALDRNYGKHDFDYVPDSNSAQASSLLRFAANVQTQLAELKAQMVDDENAELEERTARAERRARKAKVAQDRSEDQAAMALGTAAAALAFSAYLASRK